MASNDTLDLQAYLDRVGYAGTPAADLATLRDLHAAHAAAIPFENLDVRLSRPVGLDLASLQAKMVHRHRGGYCFEQNSLFAAALRAAGFTVDTLEARVRPPGATAPLPRTHMLLRVEADDRSWLADVGFGGDGPAYPVPLDGEESAQLGVRYAVRREEAGVHVLARSGGGERRDLYAFTLVSALPVDFEVAHHFTSTHPRSPFVNTLTVQRTTPELRQVLRGRTYVEQRGSGETRRELGDEEVVELVCGEIGLDVPAVDVLAALA